MNKPAINLVVALPAEAKPIRQHLELVRDNRHDQHWLYRKDHISLVVSGIGLDNSAITTDWLHSVNDHRQGDIWINLGIAGHATHPIGKIFMADRIEDQATGRHWPLHSRDTLPCPYEQVISVTQVDTNYTLDALVEMEAAGFYRSALNHTTPDRIYCLKVVSDNKDNPTHLLNGKIVSNLIREQMGVLDMLLNQIR